MKILQVITSLQTGGAEKLIIEIVPRLRAMGHEVDVCLFNGADTSFKLQLLECRCQIYCLSRSKHYYNPLHIFRLWRIMRHYDVVHTHNTAPQFFAALATQVLCSVELVTTEHNTSNRRRDWRWYPVILDRWMYTQYRHIICISKQAEINLRQYVGQCATDITTIYNGVDVRRFHEACSLPELKQQSANRFVVVMVAGFRYQKDQDTLIHAFAHLEASKYELWLVGDGERRGVLEHLVEKFCVPSQVRFLGLRTDVAEILHTADAVVMSSHFEGLSLSNIEGMAAGKPFVASDVDGLREVTKGYGILFPHGDDKSLADIIQQLATDKVLYQQVANRCYERALQFDISKMVASYNNIYMSPSCK